MQKGFSNILILIILAIAFGSLVVNLVNTASANVIYNPDEILLGPSNKKIVRLILDQTEPKLGDKISFSIKPQEDEPANIQIVCYQDSNIVYSESGESDRQFVLGGSSSIWKNNKNSAICVATLYQWLSAPKLSFLSLAQISFAAGGQR